MLFVLAGALAAALVVTLNGRDNAGSRLTRSSATASPGQHGSCQSAPVTFTAGTKAWPDCTDTGVPAGTALRQVLSPQPTGIGDSTVTEVRQSGTVIKDVDLTGSIDVYANNVTIEDSRINSLNWWGIN